MLFWSNNGTVGTNAVQFGGAVGQTGTATLDATLGANSDYAALWTIIGTGAVSIDDIQITDATGRVVASGVAEPYSSSPGILPLKKVQSFVYMIGENATSPGLGDALANSPVQMVVILGSGEQTGAQWSRNLIDPFHSRLTLSYVSVAEASTYATPELFTNGNPNVSWLGNPEGAYGLYTVQYWDPRWEPTVLAEIDNAIDQGYDGVVLDLLYADYHWSSGNPFGNPTYANAIPAMATLTSDILTHIRTRTAGKTFYVIGVDPQSTAQAAPTVISGLDGIYMDGLYYNTVTPEVYEGPGGYGASLWKGRAALYDPLGLPVFGSDYPPPGNQAANTNAINYISQFGWSGSLNPTATQATSLTYNVLSTGPLVYTATSSNSIVHAGNSFQNFLTGGAATNATLIGGDVGDTFIGGSGANTITGGAGNDTIYAHPMGVAVKNLIDIQVAADIKGGLANPTLTVLVNGKVAFGPAAVTATFENGQTQDIQIDTTVYGTVTSIELDSTGPSYIDADHLVNVQPQKITFQGQTLSFNSAQYTGSSQALNGGATAVLNPGGTITFAAPTLPIASPAFGNTADTIDGGGGVNTVIYRAAASNYTVANQADGSVLVTSASTAEGPDTLRNIQFAQFTDKTVAINSSTPLRNGAIFSTSQVTSESFLRFFNTGTTAGTVTAALSDYTTGSLLGQWTSDSIPPGAELQYPIGTVEAGAGINGTKPSYYSVTLNSGITGYFACTFTWPHPSGRDGMLAGSRPACLR
jgi:uncharacterized protein (TIGR01370 family)